MKVQFTSFARKATWASVLAVLAVGVAIAVPSVARADLVLAGGSPGASFTDLGAQGFGAAPRLLTLQTNDFESGFETPVNVENGDAVDGANKSTTPTISATGWTSGADVGIGFNSDQTGTTGITLQDLTLTIYDGTTVLGTFSTAGPIDFFHSDLVLQQGNGNAVFNFELDAAQQAAFNAILAMAGSGNFYVGLGASLGCDVGAPASCMSSNDGPDTFVAFSQEGGTPAVPIPPAALLFGTALVGMGVLGRKRRKSKGVVAPV
jgi:hypothetical protein